ncbi:MAG: hypothetical protein K8S56_00450 [Candidatus Cloacimonetes bacterium]|nr:hypothetical protein [Candidatus Cloacimonadota bacterium]
MKNLFKRKRSFHPYEDMSDGEIFCEIEELSEIWNIFYKKVLAPKGVDVNEIKFCRKSIIKAIIQVDMTKYQYKQFHNQIRLSPLKKIALYGYWILKLKPFFVDNKEFTEKINLEFAVFLFVSGLSNHIARRVGEDKLSEIQLDFEGKYFDLLFFVLQYNEVSFEAMMLAYETLGIVKFNEIGEIHE